MSLYKLKRKTPLKSGGRLNPVRDTSKARAMKRADRLWQEAICLIAGGKCRRCGCPGDSGHHIIKRRHLHTRWCLLNGVYLCMHCHQLAEEYPVEFLQFMEQRYRDQFLWYLDNRNTGEGRFSEADVLETIDELRDAIKQIKRTFSKLRHSAPRG